MSKIVDKYLELQELYQQFKKIHEVAGEDPKDQGLKAIKRRAAERIEKMALQVKEALEKLRTSPAPKSIQDIGRMIEKFAKKHRLDIELTIPGVAVIGQPQGAELKILVPLLPKASLLARVAQALNR